MLVGAWSWMGCGEVLLLLFAHAGEKRREEAGGCARRYAYRRTGGRTGWEKRVYLRLLAWYSGTLIVILRVRVLFARRCNDKSFDPLCCIVYVCRPRVFVLRGCSCTVALRRAVMSFLLACLSLTAVCGAVMSMSAWSSPPDFPIPRVRIRARRRSRSNSDGRTRPQAQTALEAPPEC
ncbi:hypothetical protein C2E23DRAFT_444907 [Lenzites betulinus]|nr:hypothetical protein C2E23DRAFT_444907 [Lenzites betulinus]